MKTILKKYGFFEEAPVALFEEVTWFRKNFQHSLLKNLHIIADPYSKTLTMYCSEPDNEINGISNGSGNDVVLYFCELSYGNIELLINFIKKRNT